MLKFKKFLLSLSLCLILLTGSVFATTMSESDIKSAFNSAAVEFFDNSEYMYFNLAEFQSAVQSYMTSNNLGTLSTNYITYLLNNDDNYFYYYDLGSVTIDSITVSDYSITINFTDSITYYEGTSYSAGDVICTYHGTVSSFDMSKNETTTGNTFDTVFTYSGNDIFTEPSSDDIDSDIFAGILATMTYILVSITTVMNSLVQVDLILFVILASLTISIIYFVVKLLKGFTGNKLVNGKKRK